VIYLVCSLDVLGDLIYSSDGRFVISWSLDSFKMLKKSECFEEDRIAELLLVDPKSYHKLKTTYSSPLLVTRTSRKIKVGRNSL
jgi:hypothetical protein